VDASEPIDLLAHECRLAISDVCPISGIISNHAGVVVERSRAQGNGSGEARHDNR
jgi:hypothetical protein